MRSFVSFAMQVRYRVWLSRVGYVTPMRHYMTPLTAMSAAVAAAAQGASTRLAARGVRRARRLSAARARARQTSPGSYASDSRGRRTRASPASGARDEALHDAPMFSGSGTAPGEQNRL